MTDTLVRPGARASYKGRLGVIVGPPSSMTTPEHGRQPIWHLVYDQPQPYGPPCGCCRPFGVAHRYRGVHTTAANLTVVNHL